jgi:hypothetical protein
VVTGMLALKANTAWARHPGVGYTRDTLTAFLRHQLTRETVVMYVTDDATSFCGGALSTFYLPPHTPLLFEWGWYGTPRGCAACWRAVKRWGARRGAQIVYRVLARPGSSPTRIRERVTWEVL